MTEEKKTSAKVHLFSEERLQYRDDSKKERSVRRSRTQEQSGNRRGQEWIKQQDRVQTNRIDGMAGTAQAKRPGSPSRYTDRLLESSGMPAGKRRREQEIEQKMNVLKRILGVLVLILIAAMIYEVVLGHGTKMTGSQRMAQQEQMKQQSMAESKTDIETELNTEAETELDTEAVTDIGTEPGTEAAAEQ